jgi:hypothetical protein
LYKLPGNALNGLSSDVNASFATPSRRYCVVTVTQNVCQPLKAQVDVWEIAHSLNDERSGLRKHDIRQPGAVRSHNQDSRIEQNHGVVERRSWIVSEEFKGQTEFLGHSFQTSFDFVVFGEMPLTRTANQNYTLTRHTRRRQKILGDVVSVEFRGQL